MHLFHLRREFTSNILFVLFTVTVYTNAVANAVQNNVQYNTVT